MDRLRLLRTIPLLLAPLAAQRQEVVPIPTLGVQFTAPAELVGAPEPVARCEQTSVHARFLVGGRLLIAHGFPTDPARKRPEQAATWSDYVGSRDPWSQDRKFVTKAEAVAAKGTRPAHRLWEYADHADSQHSIWLAAEHDTPGGVCVLAMRQHPERDGKLKSEDRRLALDVVTSVTAWDDRRAPAPELDPRALGKGREAAWAPLVERAARSLRAMPAWELLETDSLLVLASSGTAGSTHAREDDEDILASAAMHEATRTLVLTLLPELAAAKTPLTVRICSWSQRAHCFDPALWQKLDWRNLPAYLPWVRELVTVGQEDARKEKTHRGKAGILEQALHAYLGERGEPPAWNEPAAWFLTGHQMLLFNSVREMRGPWRLERDRNAYKTLARSLAKDPPALADLLRAPAVPWRSSEAQLAYAFVDFLHHGDDEKAPGWKPEWSGILARYLRELQTTRNPDQARDRAIPVGELEPALSKWIKRCAG